MCLLEGMSMTFNELKFPGQVKYRALRNKTIQYKYFMDTFMLWLRSNLCLLSLSQTYFRMGQLANTCVGRGHKWSYRDDT
jgi:hypothetical protein